MVRIIVLAFLLAALPARANNDLFTQVYSNPLHPLNPMYRQNLKNIEEGTRAWASMGPAKPTFATRVGTGIATTALVHAAVATVNGDMSWDHLTSGRFWRPVIGSAMGATLGALLPGGNMLKAFASLTGAGLGAGVLSPDKQDWTMNVAGTVGAAGLGALMSPLPGGAFVGALAGQILGWTAVGMYRTITRQHSVTKSEPVFGKDLSLLGISSKENSR